MSEKYCQLSEYREATSAITGRKLIINLSPSKVLIPPSFSAQLAKATIVEFLQYNRNSSARSMQLGGKLLALVHELQTTESRESFAATLESLLNAASIRFAKARAEDRRDITRGKGRIVHLLCRLWHAGCIVWPSTGHVLGRTNIAALDFWDHANLAYLLEPYERLNRLGQDHTSGRKSTAPARTRIFLELLLSTGGVREMGDLTPEVVGDRLVAFQQRRGHASAVGNFLAKLIQIAYPGASRIVSRDYVPLFSKGHRSDNTFRWVVTRDPSLEQWRALGEAWMLKQTRSHAGRRTALNAFFEALITDPTLPRDPLELLRGSFQLPPLPGISDGRSPVTLQPRQRMIAGFFDWILDTRCVEDGDDGSPYRIPGFQNPFRLLPSRVHQNETHRDALPTRYIRMLKEIIEENDFEWPKRLKGDYFNWYDPALGEWTRIWSPVRAYAILGKLELPLRTFQLRVLNSGEADAERYDLCQNKWVKNNHCLAGSSRERPRGVLTRVWDRSSGRDFVGLYINTNKTRDINASERERGYTIPWHYDRAISLFSNLRDWQQTYNPVRALMPWKSITEKQISRGYHADVLERRGAEVFLFRDAASMRPAEPVWQGRLQTFWLRLCDELERRLIALGETGPDGNPIRLVNRDPSGRITSGIYDLHSLRVSLITAWAEQGVPVEVLMKVAGHCTAIMTIYYQKYSIRHVTELLNDAEIKRIQGEQTNWENFIKSKRYEELESLVARNDPAALSLIVDAPGASWIRQDIGICPVGAGRCNEGGDLLQGKGEDARYGPVPGGPQNCVRCRFFITGPAFLIGLQSHFNSIGFRFREASRKYMQTETAFLKLETKRKRCHDHGEVFLETKQWQTASASFEQRTREVDEIALTWHATYRLIQECLAILRSDVSGKTGDEFALVTRSPVADLDLVLELDERGEREFELLDSVCQSAVWFHIVDAGVANLQRMRRFDAFLQRNGQSAIFCDMDETDALRVGNELAKFMYTQFRREDVNALMAGSKTLNSMGIEAETKIISAAKKLQLERAAARKALTEACG